MTRSKPRLLRFMRPLPLLGLIGAGVLLAVTSGCAVWRLGQTAALLRVSEPLSHTPAQPTSRILVVGDSTGVGTGASSPAHSLAGLLAHEEPSVWIDNRARNGARFSDVAAQLEAGGHYDIVLVLAGGNDVMHFGNFSAVQADIDRVADLGREHGTRVILMPCGNVGNAPFFLPPLSWLMTHRSRELHTWVRQAAARTGATYVNLFHERDDDPFVRVPTLNASDGLHPSDSGYQLWLSELRQQGGWPDAWLAAQDSRR